MKAVHVYVWLVALLGRALATLHIVPGATWTDTDGRAVDAHGAGVVLDNGTYYLIGESRVNGFAFANVTCYASRDLVRWQYVGALLSPAEKGDLGPQAVVERPKVIYHKARRKWVLWLHLDSQPSYKAAKVAVAEGDSVCGRYTYKYSFQPLGFQSRDMGLFKDDDESAYLLTEDRANGLRINRLTDDYLQVSEPTFLFRERIEAPAMVKINKRYYLFGSRLSGWDPNDNLYTWSDSLKGPWAKWRPFVPAGSRTYRSQTTYILDVGHGTVLYLGDRWNRNNLHASAYVWLPLVFQENQVISMGNEYSWVPNVGQGRWTKAPRRIAYEAEAARLGGSARVATCNVCRNRQAVGSLGGPGQGTLTIAGIRSNRDALTTLRIKYLNGDRRPRYAAVSVNGAAPQRVAFHSTAGHVGVSAVTVPLRAGTQNTMVIAGIGNGHAPDIDVVMVPVL